MIKAHLIDTIITVAKCKIDQSREFYITDRHTKRSGCVAIALLPLARILSILKTRWSASSTPTPFTIFTFRQMASCEKKTDIFNIQGPAISQPYSSACIDTILNVTSNHSSFAHSPVSVVWRKQIVLILFCQRPVLRPALEFITVSYICSIIIQLSSTILHIRQMESPTHSPDRCYCINNI